MSALNYVDALEMKVVETKLFQNKGYTGGLYSVEEKRVTDNIEQIDVDIKGQLPKSGSSLTLNSNGKVNDGVFYIDKYKIAYNGQTKMATSQEEVEAPVSIEEQLNQLKSEITSLKKDVINEIYPVGSVYISTTDDTVEKVSERFGGTWEKYAQGRTLIGEGTGTDSNGNVSVYEAGQTGGSLTVSLNTSNLPSHNHSYTPVGTIASTFTGAKGNTGNNSVGHTHAFSGTTSSAGEHKHTPPGGGSFFVMNNGNYNEHSNGLASGLAYNGAATGRATLVSSAGAHTHTYSGSTGGQNVNHTHSYTPTGTVVSTFTGTKSNTSSTGSGTQFNIQNPYITTYMYKRIK